MELQTIMGRLDGDPQKDVRTLTNYVFQLTEELRYLLNNLDVTNFNNLGLARYENGRMQLYAEQLSVAAKELEVKLTQADRELETRIEATVNGLRTTVEAQGGTITDLQGTVTSVSSRVSKVEQTASQIQSTVTAQGNTIGTMQSSITQNADKISAIVTNVGSYGSVTAASIVAAINDAGSNIKISADHINISGFVTFEDLSGVGKTQINGSNITSGTITGVEIRTTGNSSYGEVVIANNMIEIGTGSIYNDTYGTTRFEDSRFRFYVGNMGRYWELDGSGMSYYDSDGSYINGFAFAN